MLLNHASEYSELTDQHFQLIGKSVVEWSNIEYLLGEILSRLLITPTFLARSYIDYIGAVKLQEAIKEGVEVHRQRYHCKLITEKQLTSILELNNRVNLLRTMRNKLAHFCWVRWSDDEIFGTSFSGGVIESKKSRRSEITLTVSELAEFYKQAYEVVESLSLLVQDLPEMEEEGISKKITFHSPTTK